ncbi:hypothetical protein PG996_003069 [Apiospora saccharicola]|uniref:2EXR domain-containing protein n=1 Tax=Apiospora saccharicola TaxID=335842 RepID=A0ABR1W071_9PEZI
MADIHFPLFSSLPPEIRRQIWDHVVEQPQLIHTNGFVDEERIVQDQTSTYIYYGGDVKTQWLDTSDNQLRVYPRFPPVHDVCHEARKAFLESPGLVRETTGLGVAWRPERDILMCHDLVVGDTGYRYEWSWWDVIANRYLPAHCKAPRNPDIPGRYDVRHLRFVLDDFNEAYPVAREQYSNFQPDLCYTFGLAPDANLEKTGTSWTRTSGSLPELIELHGLGQVVVPHHPATPNGRHVHVARAQHYGSQCGGGA